MKFRPAVTALIAVALLAAIAVPAEAATKTKAASGTVPITYAVAGDAPDTVASSAGDPWTKQRLASRELCGRLRDEAK